MSRDDSADPVGTTDHESYHVPTADTSPVVTVASAIAAAREEAPMEMVPPLESVVDTDEIREHFEDAPD
ncbi:MAG: HalOD1 output domain-containing protein, partial [Halalkalicoccus sp.]